jgi:hypothetical protein
MTITQCEHEQAVGRAVASGSWPEPLSAHLRACPICSDAALVATALLAEAREAEREPLPDPGVVWRAVRRSERKRALERANLPITVMTRIALGACTAGAVAGLIWLWPTVADQFAAVARSLAAPAAPTPEGTQIALFSIALVGTFTAALALFESWAGE